MVKVWLSCSGCSSTLQFHLSFGLIGLVYLSLTATYGIGTIVAGPITAKLVSICFLPTLQHSLLLKLPVLIPHGSVIKVISAGIIFSFLTEYAKWVIFAELHVGMQQNYFNSCTTDVQLLAYSNVSSQNS